LTIYSIILFNILNIMKQIWNVFVQRYNTKIIYCNILILIYFNILYNILKDCIIKEIKKIKEDFENLCKKLTTFLAKIKKIVEM